MRKPPTEKQLEYCRDLLARFDNAEKGPDGLYPFERSRTSASRYIEKCKQISWGREHDSWLKVNENGVS